MGHGPIQGNGVPLFPGLIHNRDVAWIAPDYPQSNTIWTEEILPRFEGVALAKINREDRTVTIRGGGTLHIKSAESIDGVRGIGKRLGGVICDEAAHFDLQYAWRSVLRPAMMDNKAWALFMSSPNAGLDGNKEHLSPSFFNRLCVEVEAGRRGENWAHFFGTAFDNSILDPVEVQELIDEYPAGSIELEQEVYGKLLFAGVGLAFPEFRRDVHVRLRQDLESTYACVGGLDWGYATPGGFVLIVKDPNQRLYVARELYFNGPPRPDFPERMRPERVGLRIADTIIRYVREGGPPPEWIAADKAMWAVTDGGPNIASMVQEGIDAGCSEALMSGLLEYTPQMMPAPKGAGSRAARKLLLHHALRYERDPVSGEAMPWSPPAMQIDPSCHHLARTLPSLPLDPKNMDDVDTKAEDHLYDALTYPMMALVPDSDFAGLNDEARLARGRLDQTSQREASAFDELLNKLSKTPPRRQLGGS